MAKYVVLQVVDGEPGFMASYAPQVATAQEFSNSEQAACCNVGNHPDAEKRGKPYRVVVIPQDQWREFEVFSESTKGRKSFRAYPSEHRTIK